VKSLRDNNKELSRPPNRLPVGRHERAGKGLQRIAKKRKELLASA